MFVSPSAVPKSWGAPIFGGVHSILGAAFISQGVSISWGAPILGGCTHLLGCTCLWGLHPSLGAVPGCSPGVPSILGVHPLLGGCPLLTGCTHPRTCTHLAGVHPPLSGGHPPLGAAGCPIGGLAMPWPRGVTVGQWLAPSTTVPVSPPLPADTGCSPPGAAGVRQVIFSCSAHDSLSPEIYL